MGDTFQRLITTPGRTAGWLLRGNGEPYHRTLGYAHDQFLADDAKRILAAYPTYATTASLREIGRDRHVLLFPEETRASQEQRCREWIEAQKDNGLPYGILRQSQLLWAPEVPKVRLVAGNSSRALWYTLDSDGTFSALRVTPSNWDWDSDWSLGLPEPLKIHRMFLIVYAPPSVAEYSDDEAPSDTESMGADGVSVRHALNVAGIARSYKQAGSTLWGWILAFDPASFDPENDNTGVPGGYPDGDWFREYDDLGDFNRIQTARYFELQSTLV